MKSMVVLFTFLISTPVLADNISCMNVDEYWQEDTLEFVQEGQTTHAYYFDNDTNYSIPCETTALDGYLCVGSGITVTLYESGEATVENGTDAEVDFNCI